MSWWVGEGSLADAANKVLTPVQIEILQDHIFRWTLARKARCDRERRCFDCYRPIGSSSHQERCGPCSRLRVHLVKRRDANIIS